MGPIFIIIYHIVALLSTPSFRIYRAWRGLTLWQMGQLDKALKTGLSKTNMKTGSLESLNKVKQEINEMISKAQATDRPRGWSSVNIFVFI